MQQPELSIWLFKLPMRCEASCSAGPQFGRFPKWINIDQH